MYMQSVERTVAFPNIACILTLGEEFPSVSLASSVLPYLPFELNFDLS